MSSVTKRVRNNDPIRVEELRGLSKTATTFLRRHPKEAQLAVVAALEAAATHYVGGDETAAGPVPEALAPFIVRRPLGPDMIGVSEAAKRLQVSRTTVYDWVDKKMLLGWKVTRRGLTIPAEQILGRGKLVAGMAEVLAIIDDPELAWAFLSEDWPFAGEMARPIDKLKAGDIAAVVAAAPSFGTAFT